MDLDRFVGDNKLSYPKYFLLRQITLLFDRRIIYPMFKEYLLKKKLKKFDRLNIGCGYDLIDGWLNIGLSPEYSYGSIYFLKGKALLNFDMTRKLPLRENSIKYIYASHFIEHLTFSEGIALLNRCYKNMKIGGVIRLTFPDLELWINNYYTNNTTFFNTYKKFALNNVNSEAKTRGEIFMSQVHGWEHKWNYDFDSIKHILLKAGFKHVKRRKAFESSIPNIMDIEPNRESRIIETIYVEAIK